MKITHIAPEYPPYSGGIGSYVYNLANHLVKRKINLEIIAPSEKSNTISKEELGAFLKITRIPTNLLIKSERISFSLLNILKNLNTDLVHLHGHLSFYSLLGAFISKRKNLPSVITHHGDGIINSLVTRLTRKVRDQIGLSIFDSASKVICVNRSEISKLKKKYHIKQNKILFIPNGPTPVPYQFDESKAKRLLGPLYNTEYLLYVGFLLK
ncbi:MAG: glycosyltransferase family 4 protein, partial [Candidatus Helarchaeota archaeon]